MSPPRASSRVPSLGAIVLCGGMSRRMGKPKAWLDFEGEPLLARTVRRAAEAAWPVVVVAAPEQELPALAEGVRVARDPVTGRGPLQGLAVGLACLWDEVEDVFVSSTDAPFLAPELVRRLAALRREGHDVAIPRAGGHHQPLAAVYSRAVLPHLEALLAEDRLRPFFLLERVRTLIVEPQVLLADEALAAADPELRSFANVNTPEEYDAALALARRPYP